MKNIKLFKAVLISALTLLSVELFSTNIESETGHKARFSTKVIDRPAVIPVGIINVDTNVKYTPIKALDLDAATQFGIVKDLEGHFSYAGIKYNGEKDDHKFWGERVVKLGARYNYFNIPHVSFSAAGSLPVHIFDHEIIQDFTVGVPVVFYNDIMAGGVLGNLFNLTMRPNIEMELKFPFWFGIQVYGDLWVMVESSFGKLKMENKKNQAKWVNSGFWRELPATLSATYAFNHYFDLGANAGFDNVFKAKDTFSVGLVFTFRAGRLFG